MYPDTEVWFVRKKHEELGSDNLRTTAWLRAQGFDPGIPNYELAKECRELVGTYGIPAIIQWEVGAALDPEWYRDHKNLITCVWPPADPKIYFTTWRVKSIMVEIMKRRGWTKPIEVAHQRQIVRSYLIVRKLIQLHLGIKHPTIVIVEQNTKSFDRRSVQKWTTKLFPSWLKQEFLARGHHIVHRWVW